MSPAAAAQNKRMDIKDYLRSVRKLKSDIESMKRMRESLLYSLTGTGIPIKKTFVQESAPTDKMAVRMASVADLEREIDERIMFLMQEQSRVLEIIKALRKPEHRAIMTDYYLNALTWEKVADIHGYSQKHVERMHGMALNELREKGY